MKYDYVLWDWNGTLLDDLDTALACVNEMLCEINREPIDVERYYSLIDTPIVNFYYGLFGTRDIDFDAISVQYHNAYSRRLPHTPLTAGAQDILAYINAAGIKQLVVTSANEQTVIEQLKARGIYRYFADVLGAGDDYACSKIERAAQYFAALPGARLLMVGDTLHDLETARALGADCVLLTSGHQGRQILAGADCIVKDRLGELVQILKED